MPHVIEPAAGATRTMMAFLLAAYDEDEVGGEARTVLRLHWRLAPYQVAVLPLSKKDTLEPLARQVLKTLQPHFMCDYDVTQGIGKRYRRQDEVGTPAKATAARGRAARRGTGKNAPAKGESTAAGRGSRKNRDLGAAADEDATQQQ